MNISGFGERLTKARKDSNLTQEELACKLGVTPQAVSKWEREVSYPDIDTLYGIGTVLECSIDSLLDIAHGYAQRVIESDDEKRKISLLNKIVAEPLMLEVGAGLIDMLIEEGKNNYEKILQTRERLAAERGILMPVVRMRDNELFDKFEYRISIYDKCITKKMLAPEETFDEICNQIELVCKNYYSLLLNKQIVKSLVENIRDKYPYVVEGVIPEKISLLQLQKVLGKLVDKQVSLRNMIKIIEYMEDMIEVTSDLDSIVDYIEEKIK